ncbi:hypothetical protein GCM10009530_63110 [Microbispora corallina]|uniref:HTH cro/C1-type domain-containing protein n=1 Tax=Microbispora corallina TaxID=83302 RepID=A0ABQ4GBJ0_9ACTN|nr:helix-turn-helix transcriptional regulator [Microbispora corallina]GIH44459.1 hypothetical protein Mco01_74590 [Microbispora corallina]
MNATEIRQSRWVAADTDHDPDKVTAARKQAGFTKRETARRIGVVESLISEIEKGTRNATPPRLRQLADLFGCAVTELQRDPS